MSSTATRVIKNTGYLYAKMGITMFVSLYTTRLILNGLGASDFGIFNIVGGAIAMLGFLNAAMANATQRFMSYAEGEGNKEKQKYIFNISIILHAAIAAIVGIALVGAGWFFFNGILTIPEDRIFAAEVVYACLIVSTMFTVMSVPYDAVLNAHENMRYYAIVGIIESFLKLAVAFACVYTASDKLIVYGILMACIPFITLSIMRVYCHRHYSECVLAPKRYYSKPLMKEMTGFAGWNFLSTMSSMVCNYGQGIILNHFFGTILNAALGIAQQLNAQVMVFSNNMLKAISPVITKDEGAHEKHRVIQVSCSGSKMSFYLFAFFAIPFLLEMDYILELWLKTIPSWTVMFCRLQIILTICSQITTTFPVAINATGHIKGLTIVNCIMFVSCMFFTIIMFTFSVAPYYLFLSLLLFNVVGVSINIIYWICKLYDISWLRIINNTVLPCAKVFVLSILPGLLIVQLMPSSLLRFIVTSIISFIMCLLMIVWIGMDNDERKILASLYRKIRKL